MPLRKRYPNLISLRLVLAMFVFVLITSVFQSACGGGGGSSATPPPASTITAVVSVSCNPTSVQTGGTSQCTATVKGTGNYSSAVNWSVNTIPGGNSTFGTISSSGLYTAPGTVPNPNTVTVMAMSVQDSSKADNTTVTVTAPSSTITSVSVSCNPTSVQTGGTSQCTATVTGTGSYSSAVNWSVNGIQGGNSTVGTISTAGLYTAPSSVPSPNPVTVTATSVADTTKSASATVTITAPSALTSSASSLTFTGAAGGAHPSSQSLTISSATGSQLTVASATATTSDGANWLLLTPNGTTTTLTLNVSMDIITTGMGASTFTGTITLVAAGSTTPPLVINVSLSLASPQPPYFTGPYPYSLAPQGPVSITMPDGTVITEGSNQLFVYVSQEATTGQMQEIASAISAAGASVVGEIQYGSVLEVQVPNASVVPTLMTTLLATPGVVDVEPNLFATFSQATCQNSQSDGWAAADNLPPSTGSPSGVTILVVDCFNATICPRKTLTNADGSYVSHGQEVTSFIQNTTQGNFTIVPCDNTNPQSGASDTGLMKACVEKTAASLPLGQKLIVNFSSNAGYTTDAIKNNYNETRYTQDLNTYAGQLHSQFVAGTGPDVLFVKSAGNYSATVSAPSPPSCNFVDVGTTDTASTMSWFSNKGQAIGIYAPGCALNPDPTLFSGSDSGTSFAAPQVAGVFATLMADSPSSSACNVTSTLTCLPPALPVLNGKAMYAALIPTQPPPPAGTYSVAPTTLNLGSSGGCTGSSISGTVSVTAGAGITWTAPEQSVDISNTTASPASGGPSSTLVTITVTTNPQPVGNDGTCNTTPYPGTTAVMVFWFSNGVSSFPVAVSIYYTWLFVI